MRRKKHSRFKMYLATTLFAFMIPAIFSAILVLHNKQRYLNNIISYINKVSPINISISDLELSYRLEIILDDVKLRSKNNPSAFLDLDRASLRFNPLRIFLKKDIFYILSEVDIDNANFYPALFDNSILNRNKHNQNLNNLNTNDIKTTIENVADLFIDKNIRIRNFSTRIIDNGEASEVSLNSLNGNFRNYR